MKSIKPKENKLEMVRRRLLAYWGFRMWKNDQANRGYWHGACKSGYTVEITLRGVRFQRYNSLAEIERAFLKDSPHG